MTTKQTEVEAHKQIAEEAWRRGLATRQPEVDELHAEITTLEWKLSEANKEIERLTAAVVEIGAAHVAAQAEAERLKKEVEQVELINFRRVEEGERLRAALRQILEDLGAKILDSHRDDGWEALNS